MRDVTRLTRQLHQQIAENPLSSGAAGGQTRPYADPQNQTAAHQNSFDRLTRPMLGTITDVAAIAHCYRVAVERGSQTITAVMGVHTSLSSVGPRQINALQPGTDVVLLVHEQLSWGIILCAVPMAAVEASHGLSDVIAQTTRSRADECHKRPLKMPDNGGITDWLAGRPFDGTAGHEAGWISSNGGKITIDDFLIQLAVNEACGVFAFQHDDLLRLAGHNLQLWTAGAEREAFHDQGEYNDYNGFSPYPWEAMGLPTPGDPRRALSPEEFQLCQP